MAEWPGGETAGGPGIAGHAAEDFPDDGGDQDPADQGQSQDGDGDLGRGGYRLGEERAPWDMAGDWGSSGRRPDPDPWGDDPWTDGVRPAAAQQREAVGQGSQRSVSWPTGPQAPLSATGSGPVVRPWDVGGRGAPTAWNRNTGEWEVPSHPAEPAYSDEPAHSDEPAYSDEPASSGEPAYPDEPITLTSALIPSRPTTWPSGRPGPDPGPPPLRRIRLVRLSRNATPTG